MNGTAIETIEYIGVSDKNTRFKRIISLIDEPYIVESNQQIRNIIIPARIQAEKIAVTAHWDVYPGSKGYNDNGSGIATLLCLQNELPDNFEIVFTDQEECGGRGSAFYLKTNHPRVNINVDVVGLGGNIFYEKYGAFNLTIPDLEATEYPRVPYNDSNVFHRNGVPSILFVTGTNEENLINEIWECQHGMKNDNRLELLSEKALDKVYEYLQAMIALNS